MEAAKFLGVKEQTLASWLHKKTQPLKVVKIGRLCKYRMSDLENFIENMTQSGCDEILEKEPEQISIPKQEVII